jgi:precorrin-2 dehydrogenase/sirohydrochlorin ferrochelatase
MIIDLNLKGRQALIIGGGNEAARKVEALLSQQCDIIVVAESVEQSIEEHAANGKIALELKKIENVDFISNYDQLILILAVTDDRKLNRKIIDFAKIHGCYAYAADDPEVSDFSHPAVINVGDVVQVAISTGGKSPLMAKTLREKVEPILQNAVNELIINQIKLQERLRVKAQEILPSSDHRKKFLIAIRDDEKVLELLEANKISEANALAHKRLDEYVLKISG